MNDEKPSNPYQRQYPGAFKRKGRWTYQQGSISNDTFSFAVLGVDLNVSDHVSPEMMKMMYGSDGSENFAPKQMKPDRLTGDRVIDRKRLKRSAIFQPAEEEEEDWRYFTPQTDEVLKRISSSQDTLSSEEDMPKMKIERITTPPPACRQLSTPFSAPDVISNEHSGFVEGIDLPSPTVSCTTPISSPFEFNTTCLSSRPPKFQGAIERPSSTPLRPQDPVGFTAEKAKSLPVQPNSSFIGFKNSGSVTFDDGLKIPTLRRSWVQELSLTSGVKKMIEAIHNSLPPPVTDYSDRNEVQVVNMFNEQDLFVLPLPFVIKEEQLKIMSDVPQSSDTLENRIILEYTRLRFFQSGALTEKIIMRMMRQREGCESLLAPDGHNLIVKEMPNVAAPDNTLHMAKVLNGFPDYSPNFIKSKTVSEYLRARALPAGFVALPPPTTTAEIKAERHFLGPDPPGRKKCPWQDPRLRFIVMIPSLLPFEVRIVPPQGTDIWTPEEPIKRYRDIIINPQWMDCLLGIRWSDGANDCSFPRASR